MIWQVMVLLYCYNTIITTANTTGNTKAITAVKDWVLIQQRLNDSTIFNQNWVSFKNGFGHPLGNFWLGLQKVYELTKGLSYSIKFEGLTKSG